MIPIHDKGNFLFREKRTRVNAVFPQSENKKKDDAGQGRRERNGAVRGNDETSEVQLRVHSEGNTLQWNKNQVFPLKKTACMKRDVKA